MIQGRRVAQLGLSILLLILFVACAWFSSGDKSTRQNLVIKQAPKTKTSSSTKANVQKPAPPPITTTVNVSDLPASEDVAYDYGGIYGDEDNGDTVDLPMPPAPVNPPPDIIEPPQPNQILYDIILSLDSFWGTGSGPLDPGEWSDHGSAGHGVYLGGDAFDLMCGDGVFVFAAHNGVVTEIGYGRGGYQIISGGGFETCYSHADPYTYVGQLVTRGESIGMTGSGFGHLHFELIDGGDAVPAGDYESYF
jgi:hypothetical protein